MKKIALIIIFFNACIVQYSLAQSKTEQKKNIVVFTCKGGGGHLTASNAINDALKENYNIKIVNPFSNPNILAKELDLIASISFNTFSGEDLYNLLLRNRWHWAINQYSKMGSSWIKNHQKKLIKKMLEFLSNEKPDLIISVVPYVNNIILVAAQKLNIPFLLIPTDLNTKTFALCMNAPKYNKFKFTLAFKDSLLVDEIKQFNISKENLQFLGYPLRKNFFEEKDKEKIKKEFKLSENKTIIMLLMGAEGSQAIYSYVKHLAKIKFPLHILVCAGRNEELKTRLENTYFSKNITTTIFGFTDRISDLMSVSDLFITKAGSHSVCEALQIGVPIYIDQIGTRLDWEKLNGDFIKKYKVGNIITNFRRLNKLVKKFIEDINYKNELIQNIKKFKRKSFSEPLKKVVNQMLNVP